MKKTKVAFAAGVSLTLILTNLLINNTAHAIEIPEKLSSDQRIEVVPYDPYNVVPITGTVFTATQIIFSDNEIIQDIQNGDLGAWTSAVNKSSPHMLFIKPTVAGSDTNMTIVTNLHTYYFHLTSQTSDISPINPINHPNTPTYAVRFIYPEDQQKQLAQDLLQREQQKQTEISAFTNPSGYHWNYYFNGDKTLVPLHVFDDGKFTYFQLQPNQPIPAIFAVTSSDGKEAVVNYRRDDQDSGVYLVVPEVAPQWTLRNGPDHVASLFKGK